MTATNSDSATNKAANSYAHQHFDVVIVGAGPIGLSMARALLGGDLSVAIIEKQPLAFVQNPKPDGREIAITHRTRAIMQDLHQWQRIAASDVHYLRQAAVYNGNSAFALGFDKPKAMNGKPIDTLGFLVSNYHIRQAAFAAVAEQLQLEGSAPKGKNANQISNKTALITTLFGTAITDIQTGANFNTLTLENGHTLTSSLLIAADSRLSFVRRKVGIATDMHDFGRTVLVFRTKHTKTNHQTAHEGFYYGKTLAVLPLGEYQSSMVITVDNVQAADIKAMDDKALAALVTDWLGGSLGEMTVTGAVYDYPLIGIHARRFYGNRVALIGDAAVGMHPVTAHGYNLGMESVALLADGVLRAHAKGADVGSRVVLRHYAHTHAIKTRAMYHGTNAIVKLYTSETKPARVLRHLGVRMAQGFLPIKKVIEGQLTG